MNKSILLLISVMTIACSPKSKNRMTNDSKPMAKPNIVFIFCDDLTTQAISAYGNIYKDIAPTPHMDRIAKEGMLFNGVMCTNAICGPSRACVLTGNYNHINKYYKNENGGQFDNTQWTFPQDFQKNGYATSLFGKWHLGTKPVGFDNYMYHASNGQQGLYWNPVYNINGVDTKLEGYATNLTTDAALNWLKEGSAKDKPFMMMLQYKAPHRPWEPDKKYETLWDDVDMPYPSTFNDTYPGRETTAGDTEMTMDHFNRRDMKMTPPTGLTDKEKLAWLNFGQKNGELVQPEGMSKEEGKKWRYQKYIKDYLACVKSVDDNIGRVLDYLKATGKDQNTVIVLSSDQGFYLGDHGFFDKRFIYDESLRMPFLMKYPGVIKPGSKNNDILSNIDFAPTLLDIAGIKSTSTAMQGKSFRSMLDGSKNPAWRQSMYYHYYEWPYWHHIQPHYGIRTQRYTLAHFYYSVDTWELYDNEKDPDQLKNVINDPRYIATVADLKTQLKKLQKEYNNEFSLEHYRSITDKDFGKLNAPSIKK